MNIGGPTPGARIRAVALIIGLTVVGVVLLDLAESQSPSAGARVEQFMYCGVGQRREPLPNQPLQYTGVGPASSTRRPFELPPAAEGHHMLVTLEHGASGLGFLATRVQRRAYACVLHFIRWEA